MTSATAVGRPAPARTATARAVKTFNLAGAAKPESLGTVTVVHKGSHPLP